MKWEIIRETPWVEIDFTFEGLISSEEFLWAVLHLVEHDAALQGRLWKMGRGLNQARTAKQSVISMPKGEENLESRDGCGAVYQEIDSPVFRTRLDLRCVRLNDKRELLGRKC